MTVPAWWGVTRQQAGLRLYVAGGRRPVEANVAKYLGRHQGIFARGGAESFVLPALSLAGTLSG